MFPYTKNKLKAEVKNVVQNGIESLKINMSSTSGQVLDGLIAKI